MAPSGTPHGDPIARIRSALRVAADLPTPELTAGCLASLADATGAARIVLRSVSGASTRVEGAHPLDLRAGDADGEGPADWLPWGLGGVHAEQFLFVRDARKLPAGPRAGASLGDLGTHSAVWLPVCEHGSAIGSLTLCWAAPLDHWDDSLGPVARNVARLLLGRLDTDRRARDQGRSSTPSVPAAPSVGSDRG